MPPTVIGSNPLSELLLIVSLRITCQLIFFCNLGNLSAVSVGYWGYRYYGASPLLQLLSSPVALKLVYAYFNLL